jgi:hypothetical protein
LLYYYSITKESLLLIIYKNVDKFLKICLDENYHYHMRTPELPALIAAISLVSAGGPLAAIAQETVADNDALQETGSLYPVSNNEQNSTVNQTDVLESNDPVDVISTQLALLRKVAPEVDIENSTASEIGDLLELYGLDTEGPVCPPCP